MFFTPKSAKCQHWDCNSRAILPLFITHSDKYIDKYKAMSGIDRTELWCPNHLIDRYGKKAYKSVIRVGHYINDKHWYAKKIKYISLEIYYGMRLLE